MSQGWPNWRLFVCLGECVNDGGKKKIKAGEGAGGLLHLDHSCTQHDSHTPTLTRRHTHTHHTKYMGTYAFKHTFVTTLKSLGYLKGDYTDIHVIH